MVIRTSIWFWSPTSEVQGTSIRFQSKGQKQDGKRCQGTGGKTGKATLISTVNRSLFKLQPVTEEPSQASTWHHLIGSLDRLFKGVNFSFTFLKGKKVRIGI